jgi:hypothetical protein
LKIASRPPETSLPVSWVAPLAPVTATACGTLNMSTCELLMNRLPPRS